MFQPIIFGSVLAYTGLLFAVAYWADRRSAASPLSRSNIIVYGLSIAVYCTSWTFYGAVGTAVSSGLEYLPIYLGPALVFSVGAPVLRRMVETGKRNHTTSIADFISAHYDKSRRLAALVTFIAVVGAVPYIALQLKSVATSFDYLSPAGDAFALSAGDEANARGAFLVAIVLAAFAIMFGARHIDVTRHNRGMIAAISLDSIVKLLALCAVGAFAVAAMGGDASDAARRAPPVAQPFAGPVALDRFIVLTLLSMAAILCLPRQFHVTVVECEDARATRSASVVFLIYLALISLLVVPIARAGLAAPALDGVAPDLFVLALPLANDAQWLALFVFVGGFAAASGMVIVASVALSTMITNDLIAPFMLRTGDGHGRVGDIGPRLLTARRISIVILLMGSALFAVYAPRGEQLASFGILSFAAAAQFAPALLGALYWRSARLAGAFVGMAAGFVLWLGCLVAPSYFGVTPPIFAALMSALDVTGWDPLTKGVAVSLGGNVALFVGASAIAARSEQRVIARERRDAHPTEFAAVGSGDLYVLIERCLGERAGRAIVEEFETARGRQYDPARPADAHLTAFADRQISKAIGASSARILLRSMAAGGALKLDDVATLLGETSGKVKFSQELLQTALENISPGVSVVDAKLRLVAWNSAYVQMYRYPSDLIHEGRPIEDLIRHNAENGECGPGDVDGHVARRLAHLQAGKRHSFERVRPDGTVVKIEGVRSPSGAYVTTFTDVTEYKRIETALSDSERSIRFYTDNIPSMVAFSDRDGVVQFANSAYRAAFGLVEADIGRVHMRDIMSEDVFRARQPFVARALKGEKVSFDIEMPSSHGVQHMQVAYVPQHRADGAVRGFFGLYQDVTARRKAELALSETNETLEERVADRTRELSELNSALDAARRDAERATASKTRFLAAASHDVLQPLNAARLFASALAEGRASPRETADLADKIDASIASADRLLRSLLNISKLDAGGVIPEYSEFPLAALFDELANEFSLAAEQKGLTFRIAATSLWIRSDRGLLLSALQNLVANAVRYTDAGAVLVGARRRGKAVRIEVYDTGRGIPETRQAEIFQEFKRLERDGDVAGAGLGLATVDRISQLLSLDVDVRSSVGAGSRFSLQAPRAEQRMTQARRPAPVVGSLASVSALCIDNDAAVLEAMATALTRWGADVTAFASDDAAIKALQAGVHGSASAPPPAPDLLLIDYQLDHGRTGFDALERLEALWRARPVTIMITASSSGEAELRAARLGVPVLYKPIEPAELRALINQLLRGAAE